MTDELISKTDVVKIVKSVLSPASSLTNVARARRQMLDQIYELESKPEPHWIPVTERLPETTDAVLTTYIVNGDRSRKYVEESSYYGNDESWSSPWDEYRVAGTRIEVIAWMPKPEPYKGVNT